VKTATFSFSMRDTAHGGGSAATNIRQF